MMTDTCLNQVNFNLLDFFYDHICEINELMIANKVYIFFKKIMF
jgi:hypothetical protein